MVKIGKYNYELSERKDKKLKAKVGDKWVHFGATGYSHFFDKTKLLNKDLNHLDEKRRANYRKRHKEILLKDGRKAISDPKQPAYHSYYILW